MSSTSFHTTTVGVRFVDDVRDARDARDAAAGTGRGKISCAGELPASDWKKGYRSARFVYVPYAGLHEHVHVDVDKARRLARLWARSDEVSLDVIVHLPDDEFLDVDGLTVVEASNLMTGSWLVLSLQHRNRDRWCSMTLELYRAGLEADEGAWAAAWAAMKRLAIEELQPAGREGEVAAATDLPPDLARTVVAHEARARFEDPETRPAGWSHGACTSALWAVHECAWKHAGTPKGAAATRLMDELLADRDVADADGARKMVENGLPRTADADRDVDEAWALVGQESGRRMFVHRNILERFALSLPMSVMFYGHMPFA